MTGFKFITTESARAMRSRTILAVSTALLSSSLLLGAAAPTEEPAYVATDIISSEEASLLESDEPKQIEIDPRTGNITAVHAVSWREISEEFFEEDTASRTGSIVTPYAAYPSGCTTGRACWKGAHAPLADVGFTGTTTKGTWGGRGDFWTADQYAKLCWVDPYSNPLNPITFCMPERNGKNAWIKIGTQVTGKQVNLSPTR